MRYDVALPAPGVSGKARAAERGVSGQGRQRGMAHPAQATPRYDDGPVAKPRQSGVIVIRLARLRGITTPHARCLVLPGLGGRCAGLSYDDRPEPG